MNRTDCVIEIIGLLLLASCARPHNGKLEQSDAAGTPTSSSAVTATDTTETPLDPTGPDEPSATDEPGATGESSATGESAVVDDTSATTDDSTGSGSVTDHSAAEDGSPGQTSRDASAPEVSGGSSDAGTSDAGVAERGASVFDRDRMHVVSISVAPEDLPSLDEHTDTRVKATLEFDGLALGDVGIRNKGQTSFQPVAQKPGFSVKFDEFVAHQRLDGLKKLLLNNTTQDPTWCNETLTYETYRRAGLPAPRIAFAVVTLNGEPKGIYSIGEAVNEQFLARHYGKDMNDGNLYEGPWDFSDSVDAADLKDEVSEQRSKDDLRELQQIVQSEPDDGFAERLATRLDVDQFLLGYAIDAVTVAWDGYAYDAWNYYLYDYPGDNRFLFLPAGANWPYFRDAADAAPTVDPRVLMSLWGGGKDPASFLAGARVQRIPSLDARFEAFVRDVTHDVFDVPALHADFDRIGDVIHSVDDPDAATKRDIDTFDSHVQMAYDFVEARKAYLVEQFPR
ncbi:MAG TPA: CotH kinase family protein [Polyangiaceae bacterium]|nr:CotH kinase family protein [Polyangiaceae bacterium]